MRFVFFGTPSFSTKALDALESHGYTPALVITAPDKPRGRGLEFTPPPVKSWALERDIDVLQPTTLKDSEIQAELANTDWDVFVVAAYAKLLPQAVLDMPRRQSLNVHPSLLPSFRGPSPVISAILADERQTGVTIMAMTAQMDAGPIVAQARVEIDESDWPPPASELTDLLFTEGGNLLAETLPLWIDGKIDAVQQNDSEATYTKKFATPDARIDLSPDANGWEQFLKIRAFDSGPRAHFYAERNGQKIRVIIAEAHWAEHRLIIDTVIPEGKKPLPYNDFLQTGATPATTS
jgi:methionyl-tRNA formyltransferase